MNNLKAKLKKQGGFTLVEMLIVVAIIAILIAVSIPLISNALEKTKHATDAANERAAKAEIMIQYLADTDAVIDDKTGTAIETEKAYFYDAANGKIVTTGTSVTNEYGQHGDHIGNYIAIGITDEGEVKMVWGKSNGGMAFSSLTNADLCSGSTVKDRPAK